MATRKSNVIEFPVRRGEQDRRTRARLALAFGRLQRRFMIVRPALRIGRENGRPTKPAA